MNAFGGMRIVTSPYLTVAGEPYQAKRTWRERLDLGQPMFAWPWPPFVSHRTVVPQVPSREVLMMNGTVVMHPEMLRELERTVALRGSVF